MSLVRRSAPAPEVEHPRNAEPWFQRLPRAWREEIARKGRDEVARDTELRRRAGRRGMQETLQFAALLAATDFVCPGRSLGTVLLGFLLGALAGWIAHRLDLGRFSTSAIGLVVLSALEWTSRGGVSVVLLFVSFPFAATCAYCGYLREERGGD